MRTLTRLARVGGLAAVILAAGPAAGAAAPIVISLDGDVAVRVLVSVGTVMPCDSTSNTKLFDGTVAPKKPVTLSTDAECVCVQQTHPPFAQTGWGTPRLACRPVICEWVPQPKSKAKFVRVCRPAPDPTIRITVTSRQPE